MYVKICTYDSKIKYVPYIQIELWWSVISDGNAAMVFVNL